MEETCTHTDETKRKHTIVERRSMNEVRLSSASRPLPFPRLPPVDTDILVSSLDHCLVSHRVVVTSCRVVLALTLVRLTSISVEKEIVENFRSFFSQLSNQTLSTVLENSVSNQSRNGDGQTPSSCVQGFRN